MGKLAFGSKGIAVALSLAFWAALQAVSATASELVFDGASIYIKDSPQHLISSSDKFVVDVISNALPGYRASFVQGDGPHLDFIQEQSGISIYGTPGGNFDTVWSFGRSVSDRFGNKWGDPVVTAAGGSHLLCAIFGGNFYCRSSKKPDLLYVVRSDDQCKIDNSSLTRYEAEFDLPDCARIGGFIMEGSDDATKAVAENDAVKQWKEKAAATQEEPAPVPNQVAPTAETDNGSNSTKSKDGSVTFDQTVNFLLTTNKNWSQVNWNLWRTNITGYDEANCAVTVVTQLGNVDVFSGTLSLAGLKNWKIQRMVATDGSSNQIGYQYDQLRIQTDGTILKGTYFPATFGPASSLSFAAALGQYKQQCSNQCYLAIPSDTDAERFKKALDYLFANYCKAGEADPF